LEKIIEKLKQEISILRTGQANPVLLEEIMVDCYGSRMPLKQLAAISARDSRILVVQPWDKSIFKNIEKAVSESVPGLGVAAESEIIRISLPAPSEETRKQMVKTLNQKAEESRVAIRIKRDEAWKEIQELTQAGKIREDDKFRGKDELQKLIDEYNNKIEEMSERKEREIMTI
jgi:ribosome recycling factor